MWGFFILIKDRASAIFQIDGTITIFRQSDVEHTMKELFVI